MRDIVILAYGLGFFSLGVIAFAHRGLEAASDPFVRARPFIIAFGLIHGLSEWAGMSAFSSWGEVVNPVALVLHSASFVFLALFALIVLGARSRPRLSAAPAIVFCAWLAGCIAPGIFRGSLLAAENASRLFINLPSAALCAAAMVRGARSLASGAPNQARRGMLGLGAVFAAYGLLSAAPIAIADRGSTLSIALELARTACAIAAAILYGSVNHYLEWHSRERRIEAVGRAAKADERRRLADDLHDSVIQDLFGLGLELEAQIRQNPSCGCAPFIETARDRLNGTIGTIRRFLTGAAGELGGFMEFKGLVERSLDEVRAIPGVEVASTYSEGSARALDDRPACLYHLWRISEEAIRNARRHSRLAKLTLTVDDWKGQILLTIAGDARRPGDHPSSSQRDSADSGGYGLDSIRHRASAIGAVMGWRADEAGSRLEVRIPMEERDGRKA